MPGTDKEIARLRAELARAHRQLVGKNEKIGELREKLARSHQWLVGKNEEIAGLRTELARARSLPGSPRGKTPVFFVVGHGRSGTTWLMRILDAHPEILCRGEGYLFNRNFRRDDFRELHPRLKVSSLYNAIAGSGYLRLWVERSVWAAHEDPDGHLDNLTRQAIEYFFAEKLAKAGKRIVGDKTPFQNPRSLYDVIPGTDDEARRAAYAAPHGGAEVLEEIARIYPEAKVVHIIRDGRDVAVSMMHFLWSRAKGEEGGLYTLGPEELRRRDAYRRDPSSFAGSLFTRERLTTIAEGWNAVVGEAVERGPAVLGDRYVEVRYEDLLQRPEEEVCRLLKFLEADAREQTVKQSLAATSFERLSERKQGQEDSASVHFRKGVSGDWRNVFTEEDKRVFEERAGDLLARLGYEKDE